jgi:hypothetical protein
MNITASDRKLQNLVLYWSACFYRCHCGQALIKHQGGRDSDSGKAAESEHWAPSTHTRLFPTDAFGSIQFQSETHQSKAQVRPTQVQVWSILLPVTMCFMHHLQDKILHKNFIKHQAFHINIKTLSFLSCKTC